MNEKMILKYALVILWMIVIFLYSNEMAIASSARSAVIVGIIESAHVSLPQSILTFLARKAAHTFLYLVLGVLMYNVVRAHGVNTRRAIWISVAFAYGYAVTDEFHQSFVPGRSPEITDVMIDIAAATVGASMYYFVYKLRDSRINSKTRV